MADRNILAAETSPYLRQHAGNPVHWQPWGAPALAEAAALGRPVLLSVGYSACHWCHVMAHESFEDADTAALMNELFVCIKVDREERPDVDHLYMTALQALGEQGGWPLTMFLTPRGEPVWGGTYYPPRPAHGRPSFRQVMMAVNDAFRDDAEGIARNGAALRGALQRAAAADPGPLPNEGVILDMARRVAAMTDPVHGGLRGAPRFPNAPLFRLLWHVGMSRQEPGLRAPVRLMLQKMTEGGIHDHLGGGFARYSTDGEWLAPHFEKMLYDNAQLLELLAFACAEEASPLLEIAARGVVQWLLRDMAAGGGFAAAEDADSEGEEGRFYVWSAAEVHRLLGARGEAFAAAYDVTEAGNWEGHSILRLRHGADPAGFGAERAVLFAVRERRPRPGRDDKVLTDWNGLMIVGLCRAAGVFGVQEWVAAAVGAYRFVDARLRLQDGRFVHAWCAGRVSAPGLLEDQAAMALAAVALFEATADGAWLVEAQRAVAISGALYKASDGGFFQTAVEGSDLPESLGVRPRIAADNATPSGNGMMAEALARLYLITGENRFRVQAEALIEAFAGALPSAPTLAVAAELIAHGATLVVSGDADAPETLALLAAARRRADPTVCLAALMPHPDVVDEVARPAAHLCRHQTCSRPVHDAPALAALLAGAAP